ncbi:MAG: TonB-dependent receptor [Bacteroidales bacterium]|nr:TonB-dependent receptor [Bacteroidales bacterium]
MKYKLILFFIIFTISMRILSAQQDSIDIYELDLSQLSKLKIVSATKVSQEIKEVPATIYIISAKQIEEAGYFTLEEVLSDLPGFQFRNILGLNSYVFQRGIPNQNNLTLLLIDGVMVNELNSGGFYGGGQYNLSNIDRIEVIYGPSSVIYGTNAVSGIINIVTKSAKDARFGINTIAGNFNTFASDFNYCYVSENEDFGISVAGMIKKSDKADLRSEAGDNNWSDLMENYENDYTFDLKADYKDFSFGTNYMYKQTSNSTLIKSTDTFYKDYGTEWNIQFVNNYLKYNKLLNDKLNFSSVLYNRNATVLGNSIYYVTDTAQIGYFRPNNLSGIESILSLKANDLLSVDGGFSFEYERLSESNSWSFSDSVTIKPPKPDKPDILDNYLVSIFFEPKLNFFNHLYILTGVRFDQSSIYDQITTPKAALMLNIKKHSFRISYSEAFRAPKPWDYTYGLGNTDLLPEEMQSIEGSYSFATKFLILDIIGYKNKLENAISQESLLDGNRWINRGEINTDGVEVFLRYSKKRLSSFVNYTYNLSYDENGNDIPEIAKHSANAGITYSFNKHFRINLRANYCGRKENTKEIETTNSIYIDPYLILHSSLMITNLNGFTIKFSVKNLLNEEYYHTSNRMPDRYRQPQRTFLLTVGYRINNGK